MRERAGKAHHRHVLADALAYLVCPHCGNDLTAVGSAVRCSDGHTFDVARQGYLNLLSGVPRTGTGDTADMVAARERFLAGGHYRPIAAAMAGAAARYAANGCVVDLGAGTGYHLAATLDALPGRTGIALDVSRYALRRSARAHPRIAAVGADTWQALPLRAGVAGLCLTVFAPRNADELQRVMAPDAALLMVTPSEDHLGELIDALGLVHIDRAKRERLDRTLGTRLTHLSSSRQRYRLHLGHRDVRDLVAMGPSARHTSPDALAERVSRLPDPATVTVSVDLSVYRR